MKIKELDNQDLESINGGSWIRFTPVGAAIWLSHELINNWSDVKSGIKDGFNDAMELMENIAKNN